ncbi:uncharacterized protein [Diabrotica undecimpunctata]|uniref:uncharacterized protein n=1 Tax=Diabrotica undecimpunctata TaxID=50387 RepID=UPI003B6325B0
MTIEEVAQAVALGRRKTTSQVEDRFLSLQALGDRTLSAPIITEKQQLDCEDRDNSSFNIPLTLDELNFALNTAKNSAPGSDNTPLVFLEKLPDNAKYLSLTNVMCKVMEKIVNKILLWILEENHLLVNEQSGFQQNRTTTDNLINLESDILESFANTQETIAVFIDITKAFDTACRYDIIRSLHTWNIKASNYSLVSGRLYADDLVLVSSGKNISSVQRHLQTSLHELENWSKKTGLQFSLSKSKCLLFSKKRDPIKPQLKLCNQILNYADEIRFLGMIFDTKLTWKKHILRIKKTCQNGINLMKTVSNKNYGADYNCLIQVYKTLIRSKIDYGSIVYTSAKEYLLHHLDIIQNTALRIATGAFRTSPIESLRAETGEQSLKYRRMHLSLTYANPNNPSRSNIFTDRFKNLYTENRNMKPPFYERVRQTLKTLQIPIPNTYSNFIEIPPSWTLSIPQSDTFLNIFRENDTPHSLIKNTFINKLTKFSKSYHIYTDASKTSTGVGAAVITPNITLEYKLPSLSCIHTGELYAIYQALVYMNSSNISNALIITDSLSSINTINQLYTKHPIALLIKKKLATIQNNNYTVQFLWVPSHIGL